MVKDGKAVWAAILAFGKEPQRPLLQSAVHCGRFRLDKTQIIDDMYKKTHKSVIRNKLIAQAFYDIGYIEKYGSGAIKIIDLCKQQGLHSPEFKEVFGGFSVIFRKDIYTEEYLRSLGLNERQIKAVMYMKEEMIYNTMHNKTFIRFDTITVQAGDIL